MPDREEPPTSQPTSLREQFNQLFGAIELCIRLRWTTPALALMFSGIDVAAWLYCPNPAGVPVKQRFTAFVKKYFLPNGSFESSALELYGARCGVVHNFSSESDLSRRGEVRQILYAWGNSDVGVIREMTQLAKMEGYVAERVEDLVDAFKRGVDALFAEAKSNPALAARLQDRELKVLGSMSNEEADALLKWTKNQLES